MNTRRAVQCSLLAAAFTAIQYFSLAAPASADANLDAKYQQRARDCMLVTGRWHTPQIKKFIVSYPKGERRTKLWAMYEQARAAKARFDATPPAQLRLELLPLFSRLSPGCTPYASVAWVLASRGVDVDANVDRALTLIKTWVPSAAVDEPTAFEKTVWPYEEVAHALPPEDWPGRLADLYRIIRDDSILQAFVRLPVVLDGAGVAGWCEPVLDLTTRYPVPMVRAAAGDDAATMRLARYLTYREFGGKGQDMVGPALKKMAAGKDPKLARSARMILDRMRMAEKNQRRAMATAR